MSVSRGLFLIPLRTLLTIRRNNPQDIVHRAHPPSLVMYSRANDERSEDRGSGTARRVYAVGRVGRQGAVGGF